MKVKEVSASKKFHIGLPNYSWIEAGATIGVDIEEGENVDWDALWDTLNQQLSIQSDSIDPSWIIKKDYKNFSKVIIKIPKRKGGEENE